MEIGKRIYVMFNWGAVIAKNYFDSVPVLARTA